MSAPEPLQLVQLPPPEEGERRHTFGAMTSGEELRLIRPSPECPCAECVYLRGQQDKERDEP